MDGKLYDAAVAGDVSLLRELLENDPQILERAVIEDAPKENALHVAAQFGHSDFALEIINRKRELVCQLNSRGQSPLHAASTREMAKTLLEANTDVCFVRDKDGRTPLHTAAMRGRWDVLEELIDAKSKAAWVLTDDGEPLLHLCANYSQFEALKLLVNRIEDKEFYKLRDTDNNTILHLLAAKGQYKDIKNVLEKFKQESDILDALNRNNSTAVDNARRIQGICNRQKIRKALYHAGARKRNRVINGQKSRGESLNQINYKDDFEGKYHEVLIVVAILIATATYSATLSPPGGLWDTDGNHTKRQLTDENGEVKMNSESHFAGESIMSYRLPQQYAIFLLFNTIGFLSSILTILALISRSVFLKRKGFVLTMKVTTVASVLSLVITYGCSFYYLRAPDDDLSCILHGFPTAASFLTKAAFLAIVILYIVLLGRFLKWLLPKLGSLIYALWTKLLYLSRYCILNVRVRYTCNGRTTSVV